MRVLLAFIVTLSIATNALSKRPVVDVYQSYIQTIRQKFGSKTHKLYGIPVLHHSLSNSDRFHLIDAGNEPGDTITFAVDAQDMSVVAYLAGDNDSYFFSNAPKFAFDILFPKTNQNLLNFDNSFKSIEIAANTTREATPLGLKPSNAAIANLFHYDPVLAPVSFLIVFQMVFESAKFKFIEQRIVNSITNGEAFTPDLAMLSLEDNWSELSLEIQASNSLQGLFGSSVTLYNSKNEAVEVDSIYYPLILSNLALQLYHCNIQDYIKMPTATVADHQNPRCYVKERTVRISGQDGLCADVARDGSHVISSPCGQQANQQWTFHRDHTIRSSDKCLIPNKSKANPLAVIQNCNKVSQEDATWDVSISGTIMNPAYDLVLTSKNGINDNSLSMKKNKYCGNQGWRVGNYVEPIIASIIGVKQMCLEATEENTNIWLEECVKNKIEQSWAVFSDGSIRVNNDHSLCMTASSIESKQRIVIAKCNGLASQRWVLKADGTISTPKYEGLVMDVAQSNVDLKEIVLYPRSDLVSQHWVALY
ncbi:seed lectin [Cucumis sativus]|uniref:Ribosome-inactivating protein n=1 Tax=Cucumis sativus TaxID=3659 RepID=A0A0A0KN71_CUCSA|nr:seed lectin [Cucumis sativus]KGN51070.1 hypothetical protein Csa_008446 [Cucumis sativus]